LKYRLIYTARAVKDIESLPEPVKKRIGKTLLRYAESPQRYADRLVDSRLGSFRFRIGEYRVVFDIEGRRDCYSKGWTQERHL